MSPAKSKRPTSSGAARDGSNIVAPVASSLAGDASPSNPDVLRTLYSVLLKTRLLEEQVLSLLRAGKIPGTPVPILGGEATEVGAFIGLQPADSFSSSQPKLATHVIRGAPLEHVFANLIHGEKRAAGPVDDSESVGIVPQASSLAGQLDVAAGIALTYRNLGKPNVVVALADDGLAALGFWHQAASLAARHRLPIIFMVENCDQSHPNGAGPVQSDDDLRDRAEAYGFPGITVDGNDIVAVWRVTQESIHRARCGAGPTLIECRTWRWHAESELAATNGRPSKSRQQHDPLHHMEHYMKKRSLWKQPWKERLAQDFRATLARAVEIAHKPSRTS
jgi:TPP-dependent pyruvate/acetoin dehydrogenase alpha subunit